MTESPDNSDSSENPKITPLTPEQLHELELEAAPEVSRNDSDDNQEGEIQKAA